MIPRKKLNTKQTNLSNTKYISTSLNHTRYFHQLHFRNTPARCNTTNEPLSVVKHRRILEFPQGRRKSVAESWLGFPFNEQTLYGDYSIMRLFTPSTRYEITLRIFNTPISRHICVCDARPRTVIKLRSDSNQHRPSIQGGNHIS